MDLDHLWGESSHVCWDMTEAHTGFYTRSCVAAAQHRSTIWTIWCFIGVQHQCFLYHYCAILHTEKTFFSSDVKNLIGKSANLENCSIVVFF